MKKILLIGVMGLVGCGDASTFQITQYSSTGQVIAQYNHATNIYTGDHVGFYDSSGNYVCLYGTISIHH